MYRRLIFAAGLAAANALIPDLQQRQLLTSTSTVLIVESASSAGSSIGSSASSAGRSLSSAVTSPTTGVGGAGGAGSSSTTAASGAGGASSASATGTASLPIDTAFVAEPYSYNQQPTLNSDAISSAASFASTPASAIPGISEPAQPLISDLPADTVTHGSFTGPPATVTGAVAKGPMNSTIGPLPPNPTATVYNPNGTLNQPEPIPFQPAGGLGTNGTEPVYRVQSDFDYQSVLLALYHEWIEWDLYYAIFDQFSDDDFQFLGLSPSDRYLIEFMAQQESGHAVLLSNLLGGPGGATPSCTYNYPYRTLHEALDFAQKLTGWAEAGVWGYQAHLDSREVAQVLDQAIATEGRQQQIFRQMSGLFPMPVWFMTGIPQSWAWTYLAPYIASCPSNSKRMAWQNFPLLKVLNQPNTARWNVNDTGFEETPGWGPGAPSRDAASGDSCFNRNDTGFSCLGAISQNRSIPASWPGRQIFLSWDAPGKPVGPNNSYVTSTQVTDPKFVVWASQLNVTYSPLVNVTKSPNGTSTGVTLQPDVYTFEGDPAINGTMFIGLTDVDTPYTMYNLSMINPHIAALGLYQAG